MLDGSDIFAAGAAIMALSGYVGVVALGTNAEASDLDEENHVVDYDYIAFTSLVESK